jgi:hypothetical protein
VIIGKSSKFVRLRQMTVLYLFLLLVLLPWAIRNYITLGDFLPISNEGAHNLVYAAGPDTPERRGEFLYRGAADSTMKESSAVREALTEVRKAPFEFLWRGVRRVVWVWTYFPGTRDYFHLLSARVVSHLAQIALLAMAIFGLSRVTRQARALLLFAPLAFSLLFLITYAISRYLLPVMPFVIVAAAIGADSLLAKARRKFSLPKSAES